MIEVKVPELSESVSEATLLEWQKSSGDSVNEGDVLISVETDKIALEVPAPRSGMLKEILKQEGDSVTSGDVLALLDETAKPAAEAAKPKRLHRRLSHLHLHRRRWHPHRRCRRLKKSPPNKA